MCAAHADVIFMATAIDIAGNRTSAETEVLIIDNRPESVNITSIEYVWNEAPDYGPDYGLDYGATYYELRAGFSVLQ